MTPIEDNYNNNRYKDLRCTQREHKQWMPNSKDWYQENLPTEIVLQL